jgi:DNA-binding transcriptional ArsR family regulator
LLRTDQTAAAEPNVPLDASFAALSDVTRRGVLEQLSRSDASITDLAEKFQMTLTGMKKHVGVLAEAGLVTTEKVGRVRTCTLGPRRLEEEAGLDREIPAALGRALRRVGQGRRGIETEGEGRWTQEEEVRPHR